MTIAPTQPILKDCESKGIKELTEPHLTFIKVGFGYSLMVFIGKGFRTDGASIPEWLLYDDVYGTYIQNLLFRRFPKITTLYDIETLFRNLIGEPFDMPRLLASIVHDALYGIKWKFRWLCDIIYRRTLLQSNYPHVRADIEYTLIGLFGRKNWDSVTKDEMEQTKKLVKVEFVRNKKIPKITEGFQIKYG